MEKSNLTPPRNSDSKDDDNTKRSGGTGNNHKNKRLSENTFGFFHEFCRNDESEVEVKRSGGMASDTCRSNAPHHIEPVPLKSNLKKASENLEFNQQLRIRSRKVNWPDAHGKDIAHVQEFEPSPRAAADL
ncbi:hypothetical protein ACH5RR_032761 [Cinchona calisaya]|uniref:Uncharacterized protein n=1 Tax=Cinchona calisaya TaxID=153742 RepID=A0ABD2YLG6_9GENT